MKIDESDLKTFTQCNSKKYTWCVNDNNVRKVSCEKNFYTFLKIVLCNDNSLCFLVTTDKKLCRNACCVSSILFS